MGISGVLGDNMTVTKLILDNSYGIGTRLGECLAKNRTIQHVSAVDAELGVDGAFAVARALATNLHTAVATLDLEKMADDERDFSVDLGAALGDALAINTTLKILK